VTSGVLLPLALALWVVAMCMLVASSLVALFGRREGITIGKLWFAGSSVYRNLHSFVTPSAARWSRLLAISGCVIALAAIVLVLLRIWSVGAA
jgi:hypothetical protein